MGNLTEAQQDARADLAGLYAALFDNPQAATPTNRTMLEEAKRKAQELSLDSENICSSIDKQREFTYPRKANQGVAGWLRERFLGR